MVGLKEEIAILPNIPLAAELGDHLIATVGPFGTNNFAITFMSIHKVN